MRHRRFLLPALTAFLVALLGAFPGSLRAQTATVDQPFVVTSPAGAEAITPGVELTMTVRSPEPGKNYVWVFGDGSRPVAGTTVKHTYRGVDDYTVKLSAQAGGAQTEIGAMPLRVSPVLRGVYASDADSQITPADLFQMAVVVHAPGLSAVTVRTAGAIVAPRTTAFDVTGEDDWLVLPDMRIADERDPIIQQEVIRKPGSRLPLDKGMFTLALDYLTSSGREVTVSFTPTVRDLFRPSQTMGVTYPRIYAYAGLPAEGPGIDGFYLRGDADFTANDDPVVRTLALEWGRRSGPWPDEPEKVAMNIFTTIDSLFGDADPGEFNNIHNVARLFESGQLSRTGKNGAFICIGQAYLFTGVARALGIPAREINNAIGEATRQRADGVWEVKWWQEAGLELWYHGEWHYFDTWLGFTDRRAYLNKNLIYQSWAAYRRQATEFRTAGGAPTGLKGHDFNSWPGEPPQWSFLEEVVRDGVTVEAPQGQPQAAPITAVPLTIETVARPAPRAVAGPLPPYPAAEALVGARPAR